MLGWKDIQLGGKTSRGLNIPATWLWGLDPLTQCESFLPQWTRCWGSCGPLMVEHDCYPQAGEVFVNVVSRGGILMEILISDHPNKALAVMYAIVQAVILKLKEEKQ